MALETKLNSNFPIGQFINEGFGVPYRVGRNVNNGGIMLFVRGDIPSKLVFVENSATDDFLFK